MGTSLEVIKEQVAEAALRSGRDPGQVTIVAVSKTKPASDIERLYGEGQRIFGENYVQEAVAKIEELSGLKDIIWHFIGHLQRNKAKTAVSYFHWIETLDSLKLAKALNRHAVSQGKILKVLVQVNIGEESSKHGLLPSEVMPFFDQIQGLEALDIRGLMTIHPYEDDPDKARVWFRKMVALRDALVAKYPDLSLKELSMGMSHDFIQAIEEGATIVRIGTALFGPRKYNRAK